jgi:uroporphyrinogen-III decarboxylase
MINLPFEMLSFVRSFEKFTVDLYRQPDKVLEASEALLPGFIADGLAQAKNTNLVSVAASRCASRFISPKMFQKFVLPYFKKIVSTFTEAGKIIYIHLDQDWLKSLPFFREFPEGKYIVHLDGMTDMFKAKEILGDRFCLMGDVPATLFKLGTTEEVEAYCKKLIDVVGKGSGLILAAGCQIPDNAKFENIQTMVNTAKNYRPHKR